MKSDRKFPLNPRIYDARAERGWSQQDLADRIGTTPINISRWENGSTFPSPHFRQRLCEELGKTPVELGLLPHQRSFRISNIPIVRNPFFTGREQLLELLHERLSNERRAALTQAQVLFGLGGIGKTQTAAEYSFRYGDDYTHVFWMRCATRNTLVADFVTLSDLLNLPEKDEQDQRRVVDGVKHWLSTHEGWLLVLDNADDLLMVQEYLPKSHKGYVLYTTRAQATGAIAASVEVEKLSLNDGTLLLLRWTKLLEMDAPIESAQKADREAAELIVKEMDGLPLALVQAAAYVEETGCSLEDYLLLYATHRKELLARRSNLVLDYPETVATTWSLAFLRVEQLSPVAASILRLSAFLAPDAIPEELLTRGAASLSAVLGTETLDGFGLNEALEVLRRYSLVKRDASTHMLSIHRLVQIVLKDTMNWQNQQLWAERTVRLVNAAFPEGDYGTNANQQYYLPHIQECSMLSVQYELHFPEAAQLLYRAGDYLYFHRFYSQSQSLHQQALLIREQMFGPEHHEVAKSLNALAMIARNQGSYELAEERHKQALAIREKTLGPDHPTTAISLNNLSVLYRIQGKYELAEPPLQRALEIRQQSLGSEHPDTLLTYINLARLYAEQHHYEVAEQMLQQTLATCKSAVEPPLPHIAEILNLLASIKYEQGHNQLAGDLWTQSLAIVENTLGSEHPVTAARLHDLAKVFFAEGDFTQTLTYSERAFSISERVLGLDHPDTKAYRDLLNKILSKIEEE